MPVRTVLWKVGSQPEPLPEDSLTSEQLLETMIVASPRILSDEWMLIGRQEDTGLGGRIDLLAIAPDGTLVLIELKRARTPRDVVAQALDYAGWVEKLRPEEVAAIYGRFTSGKNLAEDFHTRFGIRLDSESLNQSHQIIVVAAALDDSTERIIRYLSDREVPINVLFFQVFANGTEQLLSRSWLLDPVQTQLSAAGAPTGSSEPWNGEFYCSFGDGPYRSWADAREHGFISAGGGLWYSRTLQLLNTNDRVWVKIPDVGFVGVGRVTGRVTPAPLFNLPAPAGETPVLDALKGASYNRALADDHDRCEYFVPVRWLESVPTDRAFYEPGLFGNQNSVCKPTTPKWRSTVDRLKQIFPGFDR